jgi:hypothetical protein
MFKVLSVLEKRVADRELIERVREKLPQVDSHKLKMLAKLSDRMEEDRHDAGAAAHGVRLPRL